MAETIRIHTATLETAHKLCEALGTYCVRVVRNGGDPSVEVDTDREFNDLLVGVLAVADAFVIAVPEAGLRLVVNGRTYPLHAPVQPGARDVPAPDAA